jgi:REP-associated tyrosine transposase
MPRQARIGLPAQVYQDGYLLECGRYIGKNPLRAGLVSSPGDYPWSSFERHRTGREDGLTDRHPLLDDQFAKGEGDAYCIYVCSARDREEQELRERMKSGIIGSQALQEILEAKWRNTRRPKRGRPRKNRP